MVGVPREKAKGHKHVDIAGLMGGPKMGPSERASLGGHHTPVLWLSSALGPVLSSLTLEDIKAKTKLGRQVGGPWGLQVRAIAAGPGMGHGDRQKWTDCRHNLRR